VTAWRKSSFSEGGSTDCVEVALTESDAWVRDSKNAAGPVVTVGATAWAGLVGWCQGSTG
jgi:hypothetical protein